MSEGPTFPGREHRRLVGSSSGGVATSPLLGTPDDRRALPFPTPMEKVWAFAFKANVAITVASAMWTFATGTTASKNALYSLELGDALHIAVYYGCRFVVWVALTYALSRWIPLALSRCSGQDLKIGFGVCAVASAMLAICMLSSKSLLCASVAAVVCSGIAQAFVRHRQIEFAAANLKVVAMAVRSMPKMFVWSLCMAVVRLILLVTGGTLLMRSIADIPRVHGPDGTIYHAADYYTTISTEDVASCECNGHIISGEIGCSYSHSGQAMFLACFWMASMEWSFAVSTSVTTASVARSVALWWSSPRDVEPVWMSCQHVIHSSLGTLCKGSAANGFIELMTEGVLRLPFVSFGGLVCQTVLFLLGGRVLSSFVPSWLPTATLVYLVQTLVVVLGFSLLLVKLVTSVVLGYTAVIAGIHRLNYSEGLDRAMELCGQVGATLVITEIVGDMGLLVAGVAPIILYLYAALSESDDFVGWALDALSVAPVHASIGVFLLPVIEVFLCAYKAVIVCFLQDPEALATNHDRRLHDGLTRAWRNRYLSSSGLAQDAAAGRMTLSSVLELGYS